MAVKSWEAIKVRYCERADCEVALEAEVIHPAEFLPDQAPRVGSHRCSRGFECSTLNRATCQWAGTNPGYDPFVERG